jgi:hypothetical protein
MANLQRVYSDVLPLPLMPCHILPKALEVMLQRLCAIDVRIDVMCYGKYFNRGCQRVFMKSVPSDGCGGDKSASSGGIHIREARRIGCMTGRHFKKPGDVVGMVFSDLFGDRKYGRWFQYFRRTDLCHPQLLTTLFWPSKPPNCSRQFY